MVRKTDKVITNKEDIKTDKVNTNREDIIILCTVVLVAGVVIDIIYKPQIPSASKPTILLYVGLICAIVFIILRISKIERELDSLRR